MKSGSSNLLHIAAFGGHAKIVAELLARRPSAYETNYQGRTPFFCAVCQGHQEAVDLLPLTTEQVLLFPLSCFFFLFSLFSFSSLFLLCNGVCRLRFVITSVALYCIW